MTSEPTGGSFAPAAGQKAIAPSSSLTIVAISIPFLDKNPESRD